MIGDPPASVAPSSVLVPTDAPTIGYGRYVLVSKLAEGGMASVYKAWDHKLRVWRAIKVLSQDYARRSVLRGRFETEAKTMARIDDPNVVQIYDVGTREALPYMVMELAEGGTVNHWLETYGTMPPRMAVSVALQAARGLHAAHLLGVVHRDVKPHNLLVTADAQCKVADFGIARVLMEEGDDITKTGAAMGTIGYMAPEQKVDARTVDARADIYGLGALLYKLVHGRIVSDLFLVEHRPSLLDGLPMALRPIVLTACFHDRERRYADAPTMIRALREALPGLPELPPDTPSLVMPMLAEMRDYTAGFPELAPLIGNERRTSPVPLPYTMSRPVRAMRVTEDSDAPSYLIETPQTPRVSPPPISLPPPAPRAATIVPTLLSGLESDRDQTTRLALGGIGFVVVALLVLTFGMSLIGGYTVRERRSERDEARVGLYEVAEKERSVLQDLAARGAYRADLEQLARLYGTFLDATDEPARSEAAERYVAALSEVSARVLTSETGAGASMARAKVLNLERAWDRYDFAEHRLDSASAGFAGRLAAATGMAGE